MWRVGNGNRDVDANSNYSSDQASRVGMEHRDRLLGKLKWGSLGSPVRGASVHPELHPQVLVFGILGPRGEDGETLGVPNLFRIPGLLDTDKMPPEMLELGGNGVSAPHASLGLRLGSGSLIPETPGVESGDSKSDLRLSDPHGGGRREVVRGRLLGPNLENEAPVLDWGVAPSVGNWRIGKPLPVP